MEANDKLEYIKSIGARALGYNASEKEKLSEGFFILGSCHCNKEIEDYNVAEGVLELEYAIKLGHVKACKLLGGMYLVGDGIEQNIEKGLTLLNIAVEKNDEEAMYVMATVYLDESQKYYNFNEGVKLLTKASNLKHILAMKELAKLYINGLVEGKDFDDAIKLFEILEKYDDSDALLALALCNLAHQENEDLAVERLKKAVKLGNVDAMTYLGEVYENGVGVRKNSKTAFKWYEKAYEGGSTVALLSLGHAYVHGIGVEANVDKGIRLLNKAYKANVPDVAIALSEAYYVKAQANPNAFTNARKFARIAAEKDGYPQGYLYLAMSYLYGEGVIPNKAKAIEYLQKAYDMGLEDAFDYIEE